MARKTLVAGILAAIVTAAATLSAPLGAAPPKISFLPFKRVDGDPNKKYELTEKNGPWMVYATSFSGEGAESQAHELVIELRQRFKLPAYVHKQHYDYTESVTGLGIDRYGAARKMKHQNAKAYDEVAVLVGNYQDLDDPELQKALQTIKYARPDALDITKKNKSAQRYAGWRYYAQLVSPKEEQKTKGLMGNAFATRNPIRPDENKGTGGLDPLVVEMNKDAEFSLLKNRGRFTVKVATFKGITTMKLDEIERLENGSMQSKLEDAAYKAHKLAAALRAKGVEAYEFHDVNESCVCVGSFASVGTPREDGKIEIDPAVHAVVQRYGAEQKTIPGAGVVGLSPKSLAGISFDVSPLPVEVPRVSIAASYARSPVRD
ncbi:MAG: hypothetical protein U0939_20280 [Pirellulales bacterium]